MDTTVQWWKIHSELNPGYWLRKKYGNHVREKGTPDSNEGGQSIPVSSKHEGIPGLVGPGEN
jgi:hypothetical protein